MKNYLDILNCYNPPEAATFEHRSCIATSQLTLPRLPRASFILPSIIWKDIHPVISYCDHCSVVTRDNALAFSQLVREVVLVWLNDVQVVRVRVSVRKVLHLVHLEESNTIKVTNSRRACVLARVVDGQSRSRVHHGGARDVNLSVVDLVLHSPRRHEFAVDILPMVVELLQSDLRLSLEIRHYLDGGVVLAIVPVVRHVAGPMRRWTSMAQNVGAAT